MTSISTLGQALDQIGRIKLTQSQLSTLAYQLSSGKKTDSFKGLGTDVITSQRARSSMAQLTKFNQNITVADRRIKMMVNSLEQVKTQAGNVVSALNVQTQQGEYEMSAVSDLAKKALQFVKNLVNEQDGDRYLFGGAETRTQPLNDRGTLDTYAKTQLDNWINGTLTTDELISSYRDSGALGDNIIGYSPALSSGNVKSAYVRVDEYTEIDYTVLGNDPGVRDIIVALSMVENLDVMLDKVAAEDSDPAGTVTAPGVGREEQNENFYRLFNDLAVMLNEGIKNINNNLYSLSQDQAQINQIKKAHTLEKSILEQTIDDVENVDLNEVAVKLNALQIQLEASYRVTASLSQLTLANFLR